MQVTPFLPTPIYQEYHLFYKLEKLNVGMIKGLGRGESLHRHSENPHTYKTEY